MKILYVVPYVPDKVRVRPYNLIRHLEHCGNHVTVLATAANGLEEQAANELRQQCKAVETFPLSTWRSITNSALGAPTQDPIQSYYCWQPDLFRRLLELVEGKGQDQFDVVHIEHLRGVRFGQELQKSLRHRNLSFPIIWDSVDSITYLFEQASRQSQKLRSRIVTWLELNRTRQYEGKMAGLFNRTLVTSHLDREAFLRLLPDKTLHGKIQVLPNGVDLDYFTPCSENIYQTDTLVVSGKMSYHANVSMTWYLVDKIMPLIWAERPETKLTIVGKDPPDEIKALGQNPNIAVTGYVPDIRPYIWSAAVAVAPLTYGAGIQNKVLEAMACGVPVVTTTKAVAALKVRSGQELLVADDPEPFARQVLNLLENQNLRSQIALKGVQYVHHNHDWRAIAEKLEEIYVEASMEKL